MGTSKRNISKKIKDLLKDIPASELNNNAPEVSKKILTKRVIQSYLVDEQSLQTSFSLITEKFNSLNSSGFGGKSKEEFLQDTLSQKEFIDLILDEIENEAYDNKDLLEKAYIIAMTKAIHMEEFDVYSFAQILFYHLINQILLKDLYDTLKDIYDDFSYDEIEKMTTNLTDQIMSTNVYNLVNEFVDKKISITKVLEQISKETDSASFGEF